MTVYTPRHKRRSGHECINTDGKSDDPRTSSPLKKAKHLEVPQLETISINADLNGAEHLQQSTNSKETTEQQPLDDESATAKSATSKENNLGYRIVYESSEYEIVDVSSDSDSNNERNPPPKKRIKIQPRNDEPRQPITKNGIYNFCLPLERESDKIPQGNLEPDSAGSEDPQAGGV